VATVAGWPASLVADDGEAVEYDELDAGVAEVDCLLSPPVFASLASWAGVSCPKKGSSKAWLMVPAVSTKPKAPATTAMRWPIVLTEAALVSTACGSWLKDDAPKNDSPTDDPSTDDPPTDDAPKVCAPPAVGCVADAGLWAVPFPDAWLRRAFRLARPAAAVAAAASWAGLFACAGDAEGLDEAASTIGMAAVAGSGVGATVTVGRAAVAGSGVEAGSGATCAGA
jgi:hypothetical protein